MCPSHPLAAAPWNNEGTNLPGSVLPRSSLSLTLEPGSLPGAKNMPRSTGQERCLSWCFLGQSTQPWFQAAHKLWLPFYKTFETWPCGLCFLADQPLPTRPPPTEISTAELVINAAWQLITQPSSLWIALGDRLMHWEVPCSLSHCTHSSCKRAICHLHSSTRSNLPVRGRVACMGRAGDSLLRPSFSFSLHSWQLQVSKQLPPSWPTETTQLQPDLSSMTMSSRAWPPPRWSWGWTSIRTGRLSSWDMGEISALLAHSSPGTPGGWIWLFSQSKTHSQGFWKAATSFNQEDNYEEAILNNSSILPKDSLSQKIHGRGL